MNGESITSVSYKYLYNSPSSYNRAFKKFEGITPRDLKKRDKELKLFNKIVFKENFKNYNIDYKIYKNKEFNLYCISKQVDYSNRTKEISAFWDEIKLKYPKVPIPHPGQSYNPKKKDLNTLLTTVVEKNKYLIPEPEPEPSSNSEVEAEWEQDEESEKITKPIANNEPVSDSNRLTKKQKRQKEIKKANKLMNKQQEEKKRIKVAISNIIGMKKFSKEQKLKEEENAKKELEEKKKEKIKNYEIKKGIIDDKELLEDFQVNKEPVPLRKMREEINPLSERWDNIMKRNIIGEYSNKIRKPANRKLKKVKYMDIDGPIEYDENLNNFKIIE